MNSLLVAFSVCTEQQCGSFRIFGSSSFVGSCRGTGECYTCTMLQGVHQQMLLITNRKRGAPEFDIFSSVFSSFFSPSSVCKVLLQQLHVVMLDMKGSGACQFCTMLTSAFETRAQGKPDSWSLLTLGTRASFKHPRVPGEVWGGAWWMLLL